MISTRISVPILGLGQSIPPNVIPQPLTAELASELNCETEKQSKLLQALYQRTRVKTRASVFSSGKDNGYKSFKSFFSDKLVSPLLGPGTNARMQYYSDKAPLLAKNAALEALERANTSPEAIKHLITISCTGFEAPGVDISLMQSLGLSESVSRTNIGFMGCHGAFNGLRVAHALSQTNPEDKILLSSVELCSLHFSHGWNPNRVVANALFADGSSAAILGGDAKPAESWQLIANGSTLFPDTKDLMSWEVGDHGFRMHLSAKVPDVIRKGLRPWLSSWLKKYGLSIGDIGSWAIHPGGPRILEATKETLDLEESDISASRKILSDYGNMSSATILFILSSLMEQQAKGPCVALGFGPGLSAEAALFSSPQ